MREVKKVKFDELAKMYCETQEQTPKGLRAVLDRQRVEFKPDGWMLLECQQMDSSRLGSRVILPYGPNNTFKEPPDFPISPRGLASDRSTVIAVWEGKE